MFTYQMKLNMQKTAKAMVKSDSLTASQRYKVACGYMMLDDISELWNQLTIGMNLFLPMIQEMLRFWLHVDGFLDICIVDEEMRLDVRNKLKQQCEEDDLSEDVKNAVESLISLLHQKTPHICKCGHVW